MHWAGLALLAAATMAMVNIFDSHLLSKRLPSFRAYLLPVGVIHVSWGLLVLYLNPLPGEVEIWPLLAAISAGALRTAAVGIMLYYLKKEHVSRVIPIVYTSPVFVAIMAIPLLGESLYYLQWLAIVVVVVGAVMVSAEKNFTGANARWGKIVLLLLMASLFFAIADIGTKYALASLSSWNLFSLTTFVMSGTFLLASARPQILRQLRDMERRNSALVLLVFNETLAPMAIALSFWAIQKGPVSLVSAVIGSRPVFVAIYSLILSLFAPNFLLKFASGKMLLLRLVAIAMIVSGIAIIYLT